MYYMAHKFHDKYGGDWDDWESEGHEIFMKAYQRYQPDKGSFVSWFNFFLVRLFTEKVRRAAMRNARLRRVEHELSLVPSKSKKHFDVSRFLLDLSEDAKTVAMLVLDAPNDVKLCMGQQKRNTPIRDRMLNSIQEFLSDTGWSSDRIFDSYDEVSQALC